MVARGAVRIDAQRRDEQTPGDRRGSQALNRCRIMSWKSTLLLVLLASAAGAWFFVGDEVAPRLGIHPANPEPVHSTAVAALDGLAAEEIVSISVAFPAGEPL